MFDFFKKIPPGLDISDFSIEILELEKKFGQLYLGTYGRVKLEKGIVEDGKIINPEELQKAIKGLFRNTLPRRLKTNRVIFSLPESKFFFHIFRLPVNLTGQELFRAVENEALKITPLDTSQLHFDLRIVSKTADIQEVLYVGTQREMVNEYLEVLRGVGLRPLVLDIESASLARAFQTEMIKEGGVLIVDMGARTTVLTVFDEGSIRLSAVVSIAGNHCTKAISEGLNISWGKAEELKRSYGLDPREMEGEMTYILQGIIEEILNEIKKSIDFYQEKSDRQIRKILLCGGSSFMPELTSYLAYKLDIETLVPDPWQGINVEKLFKKRELRSIITTELHPVFFANVIGLAKRGLKGDPEIAGINLIPAEERLSQPTFISRKLKQSKIFNSFVVFFATLAFIFLGWVVYRYIFKYLF